MSKSASSRKLQIYPLLPTKNIAAVFHGAGGWSSEQTCIKCTFKCLKYFTDTFCLCSRGAAKSRRPVNWFRHLALLHARRKSEIWRDTRAFASQLSRVTKMTLCSRGSGKVRVFRSVLMQLREGLWTTETTADQVTAVQLKVWHLSVCYHGNSMFQVLTASWLCALSCADIHPFGKIKPVNTFHIIAQQWQQSVHSKQCLLVAG